MANDQDRKRGDLEQFQGTFGNLADRFEPRADTRFIEQDLPRAELSQDAAAREQDNAQQDQPERDFLPDEESKDDFNRAAQNLDVPEQHEGQSSKQVGEDQPEPKPAPPQDSTEQDRATHAEKMTSDDSAAKDASLAAYRAFIEREAQASHSQSDGYASQSYEQGQDFDQSR